MLVYLFVPETQSQASGSSVRRGRAEAEVLHKEEWDEADGEAPGRLLVPRGHNRESSYDGNDAKHKV